MQSKSAASKKGERILRSGPICPESFLFNKAWLIFFCTAVLILCGAATACSGHCRSALLHSQLSLVWLPPHEPTVTRQRSKLKQLLTKSQKTYPAYFIAGLYRLNSELQLFLAPWAEDCRADSHFFPACGELPCGLALHTTLCNLSGGILD